MDDDLDFGASVWGTSEPVQFLAPPKPISFISSPSSPISSQVSADDDFTDFGPSPQTAHTHLDEDDFGDFGDFEGVEEDVVTTTFGEEPSFAQDNQIAGPSSYAEWHPLKLIPPENIEEQTTQILAPIWADEDISQVTSREEIREVEGVSQILVHAESRDLYNMLVQSPAPTKPPNWTRSRIRRQHLIAMGIPVNLDEVLPQANGRAMPPLQISTRPMSAPPGARHPVNSSSSSVHIAHNSRSSTPQPGGQPASHATFGPKPELDQEKIQALLQLDHDTLSMLPLPKLERHYSEIKKQLANTSAQLTHLLQVKDALQQDSETYNRLIAELVGEAQKIKTGRPRAGRKGA